jgi:hypothetical protein
MRLPVVAIAIGLCAASPVLALGETPGTPPTPGEVLPPESNAKAEPPPRPQGGAINYPTVDSAFANGDGIAVPDAADQAPGKERLTNLYEQSGLFTGFGDVRVKRLLGSGVFTTAGERLGTIKNVLLVPGSEPQVILEAGGRKIEVPWSKMVFALPGNELHGRVVLPGATQHVLEQLPEFRPQDQHGSG